MVYNKTASENFKNQCSASSFFYKWSSRATYTYTEVLTWCNSKCITGKLQKWQYGSPLFSHRFVFLCSLCYHEAELCITNAIWFLKCLFLHYAPDFIMNLPIRTSRILVYPDQKHNMWIFLWQVGILLWVAKLKSIKNYAYLT